MPKRLETAYREELNKALEKCQFIEETLKKCIISALEIARFQTSPYFPINIKSEDISKLPLGPLVRYFSKINNNLALHEALRNIIKERNYVAHQSYLFTFGELEDENHMTEATLKMKGIAARATEVHNNVLDVRYELIRSLNEVKRRAKTLLGQEVG
jgi:hypothetical protein